MSEASDLALREMILGVLKSKVETGECTIHASDFRAAITDLGLSMGSATVGNVLVNCQQNSSGNIDFSNFERQLIHERRALNAKQKVTGSSHQTAATSVTGRSNSDPVWQELDPQRAGSSARLPLREMSAELGQVYAALCRHEVSASEAEDQLYALGVEPTASFRRLTAALLRGEEVNCLPAVLH